MYSNLAGLLVHCHPENASATHYPEHQTVTRYLEYPKYGSFPRHQSAIHTGDRVTLHVCVSPCLYWLMTHNPPTGKRCIVLTAKSVCQHGMHTQQLKLTSQNKWFCQQHHAQGQQGCHAIFFFNGFPSRTHMHAGMQTSPHMHAPHIPRTCMHGGRNAQPFA